MSETLHKTEEVTQERDTSPVSHGPEESLKEIEADEAVLLVKEAGSKCIDLIRDHIKNLPPHQRWLVSARIANVIWYSVYQPTVNIASSSIVNGP